jgi:hypothetical protein
MAELVLSKAGAAVGQALLPGELAFLGGSIGRLAGSVIDARFLSPPLEGPRVKEFHLTEGREGAGIPIAYGRCRVGTQVIWASSFKEKRDVESGKGGPRVADYSYSLSFAVALCEGEIARVSRCWANGAPFDLSKVTWRLYLGTGDQAPDPLIETIEGAAPAYRGVAYIVFEDMPVDAFGARMPQLSFEIVRPAGGGPDRLEAVARAVNLIPGSGEFVLATDVIRRRMGPGRETAENLHGPEMMSDFEASLDQLEAELPGVSRVNLVVAWFGSDLRCGECLVRPGVDNADKATVPDAWSVAGIGRGAAYVVSATDGRPNYGGTPSDASVRQAVTLLKARGYHVTLYPMLLMDIAAGNGLPDPYGGEEQAAFPWRGRITPGGGEAGEQVGAFFARYGEFILHYAQLAHEAGVDGVLIGSELVALTRTRSGDEYPAVEALCELARAVRDIVGPDVELSYGADWTEYGAQTTGGDVDFPLDALWSDEAISYVGLDWYPPMADWRDGNAHADTAFGDGRSREYLAANITGGEAYDWSYTDDAGRLAQDRLPINDGAYGEPWVFRQKDIAGWWANAHHPRAAGLRLPEPSDWAPGMKPVRFIEMGVPAIDKGANQPNVFYDPKSSESALPYFSSGTRDDLIQRNAVEAFHTHWADAANNPLSDVYGGRMIPDDGIGLWAWDTRPFPSFPARSDVWSDAENWRLGHWLNGRVGLALLRDVVADVCDRAGAACDASGLAGIVTGYAITGPASARSVLEPLMLVHAGDATEREGVIVFRRRGEEIVEVDGGRLVTQNAPPVQMTRTGLENAEIHVRVRYVDAEADHAPGVVVSAESAGADMVEVEAPLLLDRDQARQLAHQLAEQIALQRELARFGMAADGLEIEAGDVVSLSGANWRITDASDGAFVMFDAVRAGESYAIAVAQAAPTAPSTPSNFVEPDIVIVDGPTLPGEEDDLRPIGFAFAEPWSGPVQFSAGVDATALSARGLVERPCTLGRLVSAIFPHVPGRWQDAAVWMKVAGGSPNSRNEAAVLNGANAMLVETEAGWELMQFREAELVDVDTYKLSGFLRGQQGSDDAAAAGAAVGARVVFLTGAEKRLAVSDWERSLRLEWRAGESRPGAPVWIGEQTYVAEANRMWSPAHLNGIRSGEDLLIGWTRRARKGGDPWTAGEPVIELPEGYRVRISGGILMRQWDVQAQTAVYAQGDQATDFPVGGTALIEVAQLGADGEPGHWAGLELIIPAP